MQGFGFWGGGGGGTFNNTMVGGAPDETIKIINDVLHGTDNTGDLIKYSTQIFYKALTILSISISLPTDFTENNDTVNGIVNGIKKLILNSITSLAPEPVAAAPPRVDEDLGVGVARRAAANGAPVDLAPDADVGPLAANGRPVGTKQVRFGPFSGGAPPDGSICKSLLEARIFDVNNDDNIDEIRAIIVDIFYYFYNAEDRKTVAELKQAQAKHTDDKIRMQETANKKHIREETKKSAEQALSEISNELAAAKDKLKRLVSAHEVFHKSIAANSNHRNRTPPAAGEVVQSEGAYRAAYGRHTDIISEINDRLDDAEKVLDTAKQYLNDANEANEEMSQAAHTTGRALKEREDALNAHNLTLIQGKITMKSNMKINIDEKIVANLKNFFDVDIPITQQKTKGGQKTQKNRIISKNRGGSRKNMNSIDSDDSDDSDDSVDPNDSHL